MATSAPARASATAMARPIPELAPVTSADCRGVEPVLPCPAVTVLPPAAAGFRRELGLVDAAVVVAGGIIGVGIFANPSNVARLVPSASGILLVWAVGGVVALIGGFVWAELASRLPHVGGQYVYLTRAYPPWVGFLYGVALLFIINGGGLAAVSILFASYLERVLVPLGPTGVKA